MAEFQQWKNIVDSNEKVCTEKKNITLDKKLPHNLSTVPVDKIRPNLYNSLINKAAVSRPKKEGEIL